MDVDDNAYRDALYGYIPYLNSLIFIVYTDYTVLELFIVYTVLEHRNVTLPHSKH